MTKTEVTNQSVFVNGVTATATEITENRTSQATVNISQNPGITVEKDVTAVNGGEITEVGLEDIITYTIKVTNTGNVDLTNLRVTDDRAVSRTYDGTPTTPNTTNLVPNGTTLEAYDSMEITVYYKITESDVLNQQANREFINTATAKGTFNNGDITHSDTATVTQQVEYPNITIEKKAPATVNAGSEMTYTITLTNTGYADGTVSVTDTLVDTLTYVAKVSGVEPSVNGQTLTWTDVLVPKKGSTTLSFTVKVGKATIGETITNTASIVDTDKSSTAITKVNSKTVTVEEYKEGQTGNSDVNIIFIMDTSSSMNEPIKGQSYDAYDSYDRYWGTYDYYIAPSDVPKTRLYNAKSAITSFVNSVYANSEMSNTNMSFITFNNDGSKVTKYTLGEEYNKTDWWDDTETVTATDGNEYRYTTESVRMGTKVISQRVNNTNYGSLITAVNNVDIGARNSGFGTEISDALGEARDLINTYKTINDNRNVVIVLGDGAIDDNYSNNLASLERVADEIYSIGFGSDATNIYSDAYENLYDISTNDKVYTAENSDELFNQFQDILSSLNNSKEYTTGIGVSGSIDAGTIEFKMTDSLVVSETSPFTIMNGETEMIKCTNINQLATYHITYNSRTNTVQWNINAYLADHPDTNLGNITIRYYVPRNG